MWGVPDPAEYRDREGRTFSQYVADQVVQAAAERGMSGRAVAVAAGLNRETLRASFNHERPFDVHAIAQIAQAFDMHPAELINATGFDAS